MQRNGLLKLLRNRVFLGAVTLAVAVLGVTFAYNANEGVPVVPTYQLNVEVPNAASLVRGNDVRMGGTRIGLINKITPKRNADGSVSAVLHVKLDRKVDPLPKDSTAIVRPRSALGLKYLEITKGSSSEGFASGDTVPLKNATPVPVEIDEVFDTFDKPTRKATQDNLRSLGDGLAGRGTDLNRALAELSPMLKNLEKVMRNLGRNTANQKRLIGGLGRVMRALAPVAGTQADLFVNMDTTFAAVASVSDYLQETITEGVTTLPVLTQQFKLQRPYLANIAQLSKEFQPGTDALRRAAPGLAGAIDNGSDVLVAATPFNKRLSKSFKNLKDFSGDPYVSLALNDLSTSFDTLDPTLKFVTPAQTVCNYGTLLFRNASSAFSEGDSYGTWQRFISIIPVAGDNNEQSPSSGPANGSSEANHLHVNPYPNTAAPGQEKECEAANETYAVGKTVIGNSEGNQGTDTDVDAEGGSK